MPSPSRCQRLLDGNGLKAASVAVISAVRIVLMTPLRQNPCRKLSPADSRSFYRYAPPHPMSSTFHSAASQHFFAICAKTKFQITSPSGTTSPKYRSRNPFFFYSLLFNFHTVVHNQGRIMRRYVLGSLFNSLRPGCGRRWTLRAIIIRSWHH